MNAMVISWKPMGIKMLLQKYFTPLWYDWMKEDLPTHHFVLCLLSYPSYPRWQAGYAVRANWEVSVGHGSISKIEMYACRLCVPPPPQWRSIAAPPPPLCGVWILGGVRTFAFTLDVFYETTWKPVGLTVDKDNLEPLTHTKCQI